MTNILEINKIFKFIVVSQNVTYFNVNKIYKFIVVSRNFSYFNIQNI